MGLRAVLRGVTEGPAGRMIAAAGLIATLTASSALGQRPLGVDVSQYQSVINWPQVSAGGRSFAIIRATHGSLQDSQFLTNMPAARAAGVLASCYHYALPLDDAPETEADFFVSYAHNYITAGYLRPALDMEEGCGTIPVGANNLSDWANRWIDRVKLLTGVEAMVYANSSYAKSCFNSSLASRTLWIADWTYPKNPNTAQPTDGTGIWSTWTFWQYSNEGNDKDVSVPGITPRVDLDAFNGTLTQLQAYLIKPPTISRSPASLSQTIRQHTNAASQTFTVGNIATGNAAILDYTISSSDTWLSASPPNGGSTGETDTITINYSTANLDVGTHTGTLTIACSSATNSPQTVVVTFTVQPIPGDLDQDGDIDEFDAAAFLNCVTGSNRGPIASGCEAADLDSDGDVDQSDFAIMQRCLSGVGVDADPHCVP